MYKDIFPELQEHLSSVIHAHALRLSKTIGLHMEDSLQEARVALFTGMQGYDYNKGTLKSYANTILRYTFVSMVTAFRAQKRVPHAMQVDDDGNVVVVKRSRLLPLDEMNEPAVMDEGLQVLMRGQSASRSVFLHRLSLALTTRERAVFNCIYVPSYGFARYLMNTSQEFSHASAGRYLGLTKNAIDYCSLGIRTKLTRLAEQEFPDTIRRAQAAKEWPMIHVSRMPSADHGFIERVIKRRQLNAIPIGERDVKASFQRKWARELVTYTWGVTLVVKNDQDEFRTFVIEGRFNYQLGQVFGANGTVKNLSDHIHWYNQLVRELS